jgi:hypothetical protein
MSEGDVFRSPQEQLEDLLKQIAEMRSLLRNISDRLNQIERHTKRAFGPVSETKKRERSSVGLGSREDLPTMSPEEALNLFERLTNLWKEHGRTTVEQKLQELQVPDLKLMTHQLGVSFPSKPSRKALQAGIIGRINESVMLSKNVNVTPPRSAEHQPSDPPSEMARDKP